MTEIISCDHCGGEPGRTVLDRRSRSTMVRQLRTANSLADVLEEILVGYRMTVDIRTGRDGGPRYDLVLRLGPDEVAELIAALVNYQTARPSDQDLGLPGPGGRAAPTTEPEADVEAQREAVGRGHHDLEGGVAPVGPFDVDQEHAVGVGQADEREQAADDGEHPERSHG